MRKIFYALAIAIFVVSCGGKSEVVEQKLPMSVKTDAIPLKVDTIKLKEEHLFVSDYIIYKDSLLLIKNKQNDSLEMLQLYSFPEQKPISNLIKYGKGPKEVVWAHIYTDNNTLIVKDFAQQQTSFIPMDSLTSPRYNPVFYNYNVFAQRLNKYDDDHILLGNPYCFADKERGIVNDAERFVVVDNNSKVNDEVEVFGKHKFQSYNVTGGAVLVNKAKNSIVYAANNFPFIEFYNYDLKLQKKYLSPDDITIDYGVYDRDGEANHLSFNEVAPYMFSESCSTDDYVYLCYNGDFLKDSEKNFDTWIFQFDWDGNFVKSYFCDRYISTLSKSNDEGVFYATVMDDDSMPMFVKLSVQ